MKKIIVIICLGFIISCSTETENSAEIQQILPENIESVVNIDSDNQSLNTFLSTNNTDKLSLNLEEVDLIEFKGDEGKYAFLIPLKTEDEGLSETLFVYFLDSDLTNFKSIIHSVESKKDSSNNDISIVSVRSIDNNWFSKREFINGKEVTSLQKSANTALPQCVIPPFTSLDTNGDGQLDQDEVAAAIEMHNILADKLSFLDFDGDGKINEQEYMTLDCFWTCVTCTLQTLGCSVSDTLCLAATYANCGVSC